MSIICSRQFFKISIRDTIDAIVLLIETRVFDSIRSSELLFWNRSTILVTLFYQYQTQAVTVSILKI
jgi:hypothetical protein